MSRRNRAYYLRRRPQGTTTGVDLELVEERVPDLGPGQALVRTTHLSVDPTTRVWMSDYPAYMPSAPLDAVLRGVGVGEVVESRRDDLPVGATVLGWTDWQDYCVADDSALISPFTVLPDPLPAPPGAFLGVLGHTGITGWLGVDIGRPQPGDTVVVSAAGGAVGSVGGQLAKLAGARVVGIASGPDKCRHVTTTLGFDTCVDRTAADWRDQLDAATPDGVDMDFENVGGEIMDHVLGRLRIGARVVLCGMISGYDALGSGSSAGQHEISQLIMKRATMHGFLVFDHADRFATIVDELAGHLAAGRLHADETVLDGLEKAPDALGQLFTGANLGKIVVRTRV
ncbi:MAG: NADP-dependent oxidoreductase [Pseudonocardia sp.]|nr:NADP-dependent oxidoreductase [Pseudonocardia sp.]